MPDLQWHIGEDAEQETIAQTTSSRPSRRNRWVALLVVVFGVSLGVMYRSIPEAAPRPAPTSLPTVPLTSTRHAVPAALYQTIEREVQALADGDFEAYLDVQLHIRPTPEEIEVQRRDFKAWGRPADSRPLYAIVDFDLLTDSSAWADIRQFRHGRYFRETRFYTHIGNRWLRNLWPDLSLWSGEEEHLQMLHFDVTYAVEDRDVILPTLRQLEEDYQALCRDLGCAAFGREMTFTVKMNTFVGYPSSPPGNNADLWFRSPRITGFFESGRAYDWVNGSDNWMLAQLITARLYSPPSIDRPGGVLLWGGTIWAVGRLEPLPDSLWDELGRLKQSSLRPLSELWVLSATTDPGPAVLQNYAVIRFVAQEYGAASIAPLLKAVNSSRSFPDVIEQGLGVSFEEFDRKWQVWAKQNVPSQ